MMKRSKAKKLWKKPEFKVLRLCCECTAYVQEAA